LANILIVDDSTVMRRGLDLILTKAGHKIVGQAASGEQAFTLFCQLRPDLVTMDITMPGIDGIETLQKILKIDPAAKVIMISALDQKRMVLEALEAGARHYLVKPFTPEKVMATVREVLEKE